MDTSNKADFDLKSVENYYLSEDDLKQILGSDSKIMTYPELASQSLETIFDPRGNVCILFLTESNTVGHWTALMKHSPELLEYFDSYGNDADTERRWLDEKKRIALKEVTPNVHNLLESFPGHVVHNTAKLQKGNTATCGRHVAVRLLHKNLPVSVYAKKLIASGNPDEAVCKATWDIIHK